jgi:transposase, IS5 family
MNSLVDFAMNEKFKEVSKRKNSLDKISKLIDWKSLTFVLPDRTPERAGRRPIPHEVMIKALCLQAWYNLSDEELEYQLHDRVSFQHFLNYKHIPDSRTIWSYKEWLQEEKFLDNFWAELQRQITSSNIVLKEGKIQDATFVYAEPGKTNSSDKINRGREAKTTRNKDATWTKKGKKSIFGYKTHFKVDMNTKFVTDIAVTTAKVHDGKIDLMNKDDIAYRDKGYSGCPTKAKGDATMKKGKLSSRQELRNQRISKKRMPGEHPLAMVVRKFKANYTKVTTIGRVMVQQVFIYSVYNLNRLRFLLGT